MDQDITGQRLRYSVRKSLILEDETFETKPKVEANSSLLISSDEDEKPKKVSRITIIMFP